MICPKCGHQFKDPGRVKGGRKSRRTLDSETARKMAAARKPKKSA